MGCKKGLVLGYYQMKGSKALADIIPTEAFKAELSHKSHGGAFDKALKRFVLNQMAY